MGGPIVRVGATPEFSEGWDRIFADEKESQASGKKKKKKSDKVKKKKKSDKNKK
ncbi:MAG: hypothetical protein N2C14_04955 [Planctomycetales bacterium]